LNRFWAWCDRALGYGKMSNPRKFWDISPSRNSNTKVRIKITEDKCMLVS